MRFLFGGIMNKASVKFLCILFDGYKSLFLSDTYLYMKLLGHKVWVCLRLIDNVKEISKAAIAIYTPTAVYESSGYAISSLTLGIYLDSLE